MISRRNRHRLELQSLEARCVLNTAYIATDLVSDQAGVAAVTDANLVNAWGIAVNPTGAFWVSSNGADMSTLYTGDVGGSPLVKNSLEVTIPGGAPTGQVFNGTSDFVVTSGAASGPARFIFAAESGIVSGWSPAVPPPAPSTAAQVAFTASDGAIYKGIALANNGTANFLYLADFHNAKIDVLDSSYHLVHLSGSFTDPNLPAHFAPFNIAAIGGKLYVAYAKQDADAEDEVAGRGLGFVDVYDTNGNFLQRLASRDRLNAPWAMIQAPSNFGDFSNDILVGNFGDGKINAYDATSGKFQGTLSESSGHPLVIDGLWGLAFGNGSVAGETSTLYYAAGPDDETHGLFGKITANAAGTSPVTAVQTGADLVITGSRNDDNVHVNLEKHGTQLSVRSRGKLIGTFDPTTLGTIQFNGLAGNDRIFVNHRIAITTILRGGAGNDMLIGGGGSNVLLGGSGNDILFGDHGRDVLIGGDGRDFLWGGANDDLLIAGRTSYDDSNSNLLSILGEWTSTESYAVRRDRLRLGSGGLPILDATSVFDTDVHDALIGGAGLDWFFAGTNDRLHDRHSNESLN